MHLRLIGIIAATVLGSASNAVAGGTPEQAVVIIDPSNATSLHVGNHYVHARDVPASNVLYMDSAAASYALFTQRELPAFLAFLDQRAISDHCDYAVVAPLDTFFVPAAGYVGDGCAPVTRFSIASVYTMGHIASYVLAGVSSGMSNRYFSSTDSAVAFDSSVAWLNGQVSTSVNARRYFIGALLGHTGTNGNSIAEILSTIDLSVASDGTHPAGTFYYMDNTADPARNVRAPSFAAALNSITALGGTAQKIVGVLPTGATDCLGVMTGASNLSPAGAGLALVPGAFCDHLTSYAATFDEGSQTKTSAWISVGASGSAGTVEEPCNYLGKFPHARFHVFYLQGLSLGESYLRSSSFVPFQGLLVGDPLARPFAHLPSVAVNDAPVGPVSGFVILTPTATTTSATAAIDSFDLLIDGVLHSTAGVSQQFTVDSRALHEGHHDLRVLARDDSAVASTGRWVGSLSVANLGAPISLGVVPVAGDRAQSFQFTVSGQSVVPLETRLVQNGRVIASATGQNPTLAVFGHNLGAGKSRVRAEMVLHGHRIVRSAPVLVDVAASGGGSGAIPVAFDYSKRVTGSTPYVVELPAIYDVDPALATYAVVQAPSQATVAGGTGPYRFVTPAAGARGSEVMTFQITAPSGTSNVGRVTLVYTELAKTRHP